MGELITLMPGRRLEELADPDPETHEQAIANLEAARLRRELRSLPPLERRVICWRYGLGVDRAELSVRQVARRLNVSVGTAWSIEQRGLEMLRSSFGARAAA